MKAFSTAGFVCIVLWVQAIHAQLPPAYERFYGDPLIGFDPSINYTETGSGSVQIAGGLCTDPTVQCFELTPSDASEVAVTFSLPTEQFLGNYNDLYVAVSVAESLGSAGYYCAVEVNVDNKGFDRLFNQEGFGQLIEHAMSTRSDVIFPGSTIAVRLIAGTSQQFAEPFSCFFTDLVLAGSSAIATTQFQTTLDGPPPAVDGVLGCDDNVTFVSTSANSYYALDITEFVTISVETCRSVQTGVDTQLRVWDASMLWLISDACSDDCGTCMGPGSDGTLQENITLSLIPGSYVIEVGPLGGNSPGYSGDNAWYYNLNGYDCQQGFVFIEAESAAYLLDHCQSGSSNSYRYSCWNGMLYREDFSAANCNASASTGQSEFFNYDAFHCGQDHGMGTMA